MYDDGRRERMYKGIPQGSVLGPIICNFVLNNLFNNIFSDRLKFPMTSDLINLKGNQRGISVTRYILGYADDIIFKVINITEAEILKEEIQKRLGTAGLKLSENKTKIYDLKIKQKFE